MSEEDTLERLKVDTGEFIDRLKKERDQLRVQSHLFKAEMKDEWEEIESKWRYVERRAEHLLDESRESAEQIGDAIKQVGDEIAQAYRRMRES